jgi:hypothetical protein
MASRLGDGKRVILRLMVESSVTAVRAVVADEVRNINRIWEFAAPPYIEIEERYNVAPSR